MSRSVTSRRSLGGAPSHRSAKTTLPRISSGISFASRQPEKRSQLSLIQRSIPMSMAASGTKIVVAQERAVRILENLGKRIPKLNLNSNQQFNFCVALKQLHEQVEDPKESGFWADWEVLKQNIISAITEQSIQPTNGDAFSDFCNSALDQFSINLGKVREKIPTPSVSLAPNNSETSNSLNTLSNSSSSSKKIEDVNLKFNQLAESFSRLQKRFINIGQICDDYAQMRSLIAKLGAFRQVLPNEYQVVFSNMRDLDIKKGNGKVAFHPLLTNNQRNSIIRSLTSQIESIEHRIMEHLDPKLSVTSVIDDLQTVELNLRKVITDFPEEKRKEKSKDNIILEEKQQRYNALESKIAELKMRTSELSGELAMLNSSESFLKDKINEEKKSWKAEKKELLAALTNPIDQNAIQRSAETLERLKKTNVQLQNEINSRRSEDNDIEDLRKKNKEIKQKFNAAQLQVAKTEEDLFKMRAKNSVLVELLDDDQIEYKKNTPLFIGKKEAQICLGNETEKDFQLRNMKDKRYQIQTAVNEKTPSIKEFSRQISLNQNLYDQIESQLKQLEKLQIRIFRRKFKNHILNSTNQEYERVSKQYSGIDNNNTNTILNDESELGQLKAEAELLKGEFKLSVLRNSRRNSLNADENHQIEEQKRLNQKIIKNGNQIRHYLLRVQSTNGAINVAIKSNKNIDVINEERRKKNDSAHKYDEVRRHQDGATEEIERLLGIEPADGAVIETRFAVITEEIRRLEEAVVGEGELADIVETLKRRYRGIERRKNRPPPLKDEYSDNI